MFKRLVLVVSVCLLAVLLHAPGAEAQQAEKPVFNGPPAPDEMMVFAPFIGKWNTQATIKPSVRHKEGYTSQGEMTCEWMHNGHYLRVEGHGVSQHGRFEHTTIISYHRPTGTFRQVAFSTDGIVGEGICEWDDKNQILTTKGVNLPEGWTALFTMKLENDRLLQTALVKNDKGETVRDGAVVAERKK